LPRLTASRPITSSWSCSRSPSQSRRSSTSTPVFSLRVSNHIVRSYCGTGCTITRRRPAVEQGTSWWRRTACTCIPEPCCGPTSKLTLSASAPLLSSRPLCIVMYHHVQGEEHAAAHPQQRVCRPRCWRRQEQQGAVRAVLQRPARHPGPQGDGNNATGTDFPPLHRSEAGPA
jgi:hypothetical protein